jgi:signal transduction histidine kinase
VNLKDDRSSSLRRKLRRVILGTTLVALFVALGSMIAYDVRLYHRTWTADMATQAELLARTCVPALLFDDPGVARENLALLRLRPNVLSAAIYGPRGATFASYSRDPGDTPVPPLPGADGIHVVGSFVEVNHRIVEDGAILGTFYLRARHGLGDRILQHLLIASFLAVLGMVVAYVYSERLQRSVSQPILEVARVAREIAETADYSRRAPRLSDDEVGLLGESFNGLLAEVEARSHALAETNAELAREMSVKAEAQREILRLNSELEERVRDRTAQLTSAMQELETFCYSVSHDLRAPLRGIHGFSQALVADFPRDLPDEAHRYLSRITASATRMEQLIEDLLNLSKLTRATLTRREVDLSDLAGRVVENLRTTDPDRRVEVLIREGMKVDADPRLLQTAIENLLGNAWKFTAKTELPRIEVGCMRDGARTVHFVRDNGAGFDMQYADKLFGAFQRLHRQDEFPGTGIGLATVARVVHRHGGRIWADGQIGAGAAFYFTLAEPVAGATDAPETTNGEA